MDAEELKNADEKWKKQIKKVICFHGTSRANAEAIRIKGFRAGTFFAKHLEDALEFGGPWVFQICFDEALLPPGCWQFRIIDYLPTSQILRLTHYEKIRKKYENATLREAIFAEDLRRLYEGNNGNEI